MFPVRWTAPEAYNDRRCTEKSDVWSFGVMCYEVFTGAALPYAGMDNCTVEERVIAGYRLSCPPDCPLATHKALMLDCWRVDPAMRPTFAALQQCLHATAMLGVLHKGGAKGALEADMLSQSPGRHVSPAMGVSKDTSAPGASSDDNSGPQTSAASVYLGVVGRSGSLLEAGRSVDPCDIPVAPAAIDHSGVTAFAAPCCTLPAGNATAVADGHPPRIAWSSLKSKSCRSSMSEV